MKNAKATVPSYVCNIPIPPLTPPLPKDCPEISRNADNPLNYSNSLHPVLYVYVIKHQHGSLISTQLRTGYPVTYQSRVLVQTTRLPHAPSGSIFSFLFFFFSFLFLFLLLFGWLA